MPEKNNNRWIYSPADLDRMYEKGLFKEEILPKKVFEKILSRTSSGFNVWSPALTDFEAPLGKQNAGFNICWECGNLYLVTPIRDAYDVNKEGRVCNSCVCDVTGGHY